MIILALIRLTILRGISSQDYGTRSRAHRIAARFSRRHSFDARA